MVRWARYPGGLIWHVILDEEDRQLLRQRVWALCVHALWDEVPTLEILEGQTPIDTPTQIRCPSCQRLLESLRSDKL